MYFFVRTFITVFVGVGLAFAIVISSALMDLQKSALKELSLRTLSEAHLVATLYNSMQSQKALEVAKARIPHMRVSLFNNVGDLIDDSHVDKKDFSPAYNYADRTEIKKAQSHGEGTGTGYLDEVQSKAVFAAVRLKNHNVIRLAAPIDGYLPLLQDNNKFITLAFILTLILAFSIAYLLSSPLKSDLMQIMHTIEAIAQGKYHLRLTNLLNKEITPLESKVNHMAIQVQEHIRTMADQKEQLQSILDTMKEGVLVLGPNGGIRRYNKALRTMFPDLDKAQGMQVVEIIPAPALQDAIEKIIKLPVHSGTTLPHTGPLQLELAPERIFSIQLTRAGSNNLNLGAVAVFHDISELMRLERIRSDFVANVSHELRTPLTAIQGYAETLTELEDLTENSRRFAEIIRKHGAYLARMVEELLALARLESGDVPMQVLAINPMESINSALALCRRQFDIQELKTILQVPKDLMVVANAQHLTQIFRNLLENAGRYAPKGGQVHIKALQDSQEKSMTLFAVCDNGPGIPAADKDRIFERFYRVEKHRSQGSTGLGLAICKHTLERLGGRIWVESPTKEFTTVFYFTIPTALGDVK